MNTQIPTIMVVEDEKLLLEIITRKLKLNNIDVLAFSNGHDALAQLTKLEVLPDALWLDYYLTDMNGLVFMQQLKANPKWETIPVIVVSNSASTDKVKTMLGLGAKKYILKAEYRLEDVINIIQEFIAQEKKQHA